MKTTSEMIQEAIRDRDYSTLAILIWRREQDGVPTKEIHDIFRAIGHQIVKDDGMVIVHTAIENSCAGCGDKLVCLRCDSSDETIATLLAIANGEAVLHWVPPSQRKPTDSQ